MSQRRASSLTGNSSSVGIPEVIADGIGYNVVMEAVSIESKWSDLLAKAAHYLFREGDEFRQLSLRCLSNSALRSDFQQHCEQRFRLPWTVELTERDADHALKELLVVLDELDMQQIGRGLLWEQLIPRIDAIVRGLETRDRCDLAALGGYLNACWCMSPEVLNHLSQHLISEFSRSEIQGGSFPAVSSFFHFFSYCSDESADPILQWCGRELERGYRAGLFSNLQLARLFRLCRAQALPASRVSLDEVASALEEEQNADGSFGKGSGKEKVRNTWEVYGSLSFYCRSSK